MAARSLGLGILVTSNAANAHQQIEATCRVT
jgi:hypothetical protein